MKYMILTNNPLAVEEYGATHNVMFIDAGSADILHEARKMIGGGCVLLNHPLYGSVKPNETPYRSLLLMDAEDKSLNAVSDEGSSRSLIERALLTYSKFTDKKETTDPKLLQDYQVVDLSLLASAVVAADE